MSNMNFYNWYEKLKDMEISRPNDINGDWSLKTIEDISIARREEPEEQEIDIRDMEKKESTNQQFARLGGNQYRHSPDLSPIKQSINVCIKCSKNLSEEVTDKCPHCGFVWGSPL